MSRKSFEYFGQMPSVNYGRYTDEANIASDIIKKLEPKATDRLLDIGCGTGKITIPLSRLVRETTCIDHPSILDNSELRSFKLIPGNFLDVVVEDKFDKILCYSVLHYLSDMDEVMAFIEKAVSLLAPGGIALFGDIPNKSNKYTLSITEFCLVFCKSWWIRLFGRKPAPSSNDTKLVRFTNDEIMEICYYLRDAGYRPRILPQPTNLPFWRIREDILICK
jgi:SAM-dependent methyltransferase